MRWRSRHSARSVRAVMPLQLAALLQHQERVEHRRGPALEEVLVAHVEQLVDALELAVDGDRRRGGGIQACVQVLQQDRC